MSRQASIQFDYRSCIVEIGQGLELFLIGIVMAATVYCDGEQELDPSDDFDLWRRSWDVVRPAWEATARACG